LQIKAKLHFKILFFSMLATGQVNQLGEENFSQWKENQ